MSQDREKVLQTTKVRTSIKSDLSWNQKMKRAAEDVKESTELEKDKKSPSLRQVSYVLMTAKKFESATRPPQSPKELTCSKEPDTSEYILPEPVSPEPTVASTTTEEKNYVEPPKSKNSAEISTTVVKEGCENDTFEAYIVNDAASVDESVASMVPDVLAESLFKSPPPQENCNEVSKANALDILSDSLVEPILSSESNEVFKANALAILSDSSVKTIIRSESKEADASPSFETETDQNAYESAETVLNGNTNTLKDDKPAVADLPQVSLLSTETLSTPTKEDILLSKTTTVEVTVVQNDAELAQGEACAEAEVAKEPEVSSISSDADVPQDNAEIKETELTSTKDCVEPGTTSADVKVQNNVGSNRYIEETVEKPNKPESSIATTLPKDKTKTEETQSTAPKKEIVASGSSSQVIVVKNYAEPIKGQAKEETVEVPKEYEVSTVLSEADVPQDNTESKETYLTSTKEASGTASAEVNIDKNNVDPLNTSEEAFEVPKEPEIPVIVRNVPQNNAEPKEEDLEVDEQKAQTETTYDSMQVTETLVVIPNENVEDLNKVEENVKCTAECSSQTPGLAEMNQDDIFKAEHVVVESSPESSASEVGESSSRKNIATVEETSPMVPFVAGENQAIFDISDALDVVLNSEQSKEEGDTFEITDKSDEVTADKTVKEFEELKDSSGEQLPTDNNSAPSSVEKEETYSKFIMRHGKEVCSHCDQFIGLIKLIFSYPPMYLHPDCLTCGLCAKILGALLTPIFEHNHQIYCCDCYDKVYCLN